MPLRNQATDLTCLLALDSSTDVLTFLMTASKFVDNLLLGKGLSADLLTQIELMIGGHFYRLANPEIVQESYADSKFSYSLGKREQGLSSTSWGQTAITMDSSGTLTDLGKVRASLSSL